MERVAIRSRRAKRVAEWFGLPMGRKGEANSVPETRGPELSGGKIILISGPSGAGKSTLLRRMQRRCLGSWIDLQKLKLPNRPVVDCMKGRNLESVLLQLGRVGLGEAWTYLRLPSELSDGQRWRLRLAMGIEQAEADSTSSLTVLAADEFGAVLDRITAAVVARAVRRTIDGLPNVCGVFATSHDDLGEALRPDVWVRCDFGRVEVGTR